MTQIDVKLQSLPEPQQRLWIELGDIPKEFVLYGGTAIALHLGHRVSVDFDFFSAETFDPDKLLESVPFLDGAAVLQKNENTLTTLVDREGPIQVSFFGVPRLGRIREPLIVPEIHLKVAALVDLSGTKVAVIQKRAEAKDYLDIDAIIQHKEINLATALAAGKVLYGSSFNPELTLKAMCFFGDGNLESLPQATQMRLIEAVKAVQLDQLPVLEAFREWRGRQSGP